MSNLEQRLTELEVRLTFIDEAVQALTTVDAEQSLRIVELERMVRELRSELATVRTGQGHDPHSEPPPPHY
jgi:SlyX protein